MTRDYKHSVAKQSLSGQWQRRAMDMLTGLGLGLFVALLVRLDLLRLPSNLDKRPDTAGVVEERYEPDPQRSNEVVAFDFFTILPEFEIKVPDWSIGKPDNEDDGLEGSYLLQVGSFRSYRDADSRKASLALQGISANIQRAVINGQEVWFRVMVGPFNGKAELQQIRRKLIENSMDMMIIQLKAGPA